MLNRTAAITLCAAALTPFTVPIAALAQTTSTWNGTTGNWTNAAIWSTNPFFPNDGNGGQNYNAVVNGGGTITLDVPITIEQLNFSSGTITGSNNLTLNGGLTWSGNSTMSGAGATTTVAGAAALGGPGNPMTLGRNLTLNGNTSWTGANQTIALTAGSGATLTIGAGTTFTDATTAAANAITFGGASAAGLSIVNNGTYAKTGASPTTVSVPFNNSGTVSVQNGTLSLTAGGSSANSSFAVTASGATLNFGPGTYTGASFAVAGGGAVFFTNGTATLDAATSFSGSGSVIASGGSATVTGPFASTLNIGASAGSLNFNDGPYTVASLAVINIGTFGGTANLTTSGGFTWANGTMSGPGGTTVGGASALGNISGPVTLVLGRNLTLNGNTSWTGANQTIALTAGSGTTLTIGAGTTFTDATTAAANAITFGGASAAGLSIVNNGTYAKTGAGPTTTVGVPFINNGGTVSVQNGTLSLSAGGSSTDGTFSIGPSAALQFVGGAFSFAGVTTFTGAFNVNTPTTITSGSFNITGATTVSNVLTIGSAGILTGSGSVSVTNPGTLAVQGTVNQPVTVAGVLSGNGSINNTVFIQPGAHLKPGNSPGTITINGDLTLNGNYDWDLAGNDNTVAGGTFDKVDVSGVTKLDPPAVNANFGGSLSFANPFWDQPRTWDILDTGSFFDNALPNLTTSDTSYRAFYPNGSFSLKLAGNSLDVVWNPTGVPEPSTTALTAAGLAVAAWAGRRRKK